MKPVKDTATVILAGGASKRLGYDKKYLFWGESTLLSVVIEKAKLLTEEVIVSLAKPEPLVSKWGKSSIKLVYDQEQKKGPLMGLITGFNKSKAQKILLLAVDMPFLSVEFLLYLLSLREGFDIVVPLWNKNLEPTTAIYARTCLPLLETSLKSNQLSLNKFILDSPLKIRYVVKEAIKNFADPRHLFYNINTQTDWERAKSYVNR